MQVQIPSLKHARAYFVRRSSAVLLTFAVALSMIDGGAGCALQTRTADGAGTISCVQEMDCPSSNDPCVVSTCFEQRCLMVNAALNTVIDLQVAHDCRMRVCDGNGQALEIHDDIDLPSDDGNPCTRGVCKSGDIAHAPVAVGQTCETNGVCNGRGACGECLPEATRCDGRAVATCSEEGQWTKDMCPAGKPLCKNASCLGIKQVAAGGSNTCVLFDDGTARCFGAEGSRRGQRGITPVAGIFSATELALGAAHSCARLDDGSVQCWGANTFGQVGDGTIEGPRPPTPVLGLSDATAIAAGNEHTCAIVAGGKVVCWGRGDHGEFGGPAPRRIAPSAAGKPKVVPDEPSLSRPEPGGPSTAIAGVTGASLVALGVRHGCILMRGGRVGCFGEDDSNQLGTAFVASDTGKPKPAFRPAPTLRLVTVKGIEGAIAISLGARHGCAIVSGGAVRCWGDNTKGQLGDGTTQSRTESVAVADISNATALALGAEHSCVLDSGKGHVRCWGDNAHNQLGDGTTTAHSSPVDVAGLSGVHSISSAHGTHTCVMLEGGEVRCWGSNHLGELGDGSLDDRGSPVSVVW